MTAHEDVSRPRLSAPAELMIDETTAHVTAPAPQIQPLLQWFHERGIRCQLRPRGGIGGLDLLDFGNPSRALEQCIRSAFDEWLTQQGTTRPAS